MTNDESRDELIGRLKADVATLQQFRESIRNTEQYWRGVHPEWLSVAELADLARRAITTLCEITDSQLQISIARLEALQAAAQDTHDDGRRHSGISASAAASDS